MNNNRPVGRKVTHSGGGLGVGRTGSGSGGGKVGGGGFFSGGSGSGSSGGSTGGYNGSGGGLQRAARSKPGCITIIVVLLAMMFGGGKVAYDGANDGIDYQDAVQYGSGSYSGWYTDNQNTGNTGLLNTQVSSAARDKFTTIKGDGTDTATIMVYMCGTDLESQSAMGTSDLNEMIKATVGNRVNLIVYTGGCRSWRNNVISSKNNQIWQISGGNIKKSRR